MDQENVTVDATTEVIEPETSTESVETPEMGQTSEETADTSETVQTESEKPRKQSRASERIRELIAQKKALEAENASLRQTQDIELEGVDETGIDPKKFAESLERRITQKAQQMATGATAYAEAERQFPLVKDNNLVRSRAATLVDEGYDPIQAAEIASLEWQEATGQEAKKTIQRQQASQNLRQGAQIPQAGKAVTSSGMFTRAEIARMSPQEYVKNQSAIQAQLEKFGAQSFE